MKKREISGTDRLTNIMFFVAAAAMLVISVQRANEARNYANAAADAAEMSVSCVTAWNRVYYSTSADREYESIEEFKQARKILTAEMMEACGTSEENQ